MTTSQTTDDLRLILGICPQTTDFNKTLNPDFRFILNVSLMGIDADQRKLARSRANEVCETITKATGQDTQGNSEINSALQASDSEALFQSYSRVLKHAIRTFLGSTHQALASVKEIHWYPDMSCRAEALHASQSDTAKAKEEFDGLGGYYPQHDSTRGSHQPVEVLQAYPTASDQSNGSVNPIRQDDHDSLVVLSSLSLNQ